MQHIPKMFRRYIKKFFEDLSMCAMPIPSGPGRAETVRLQTVMQTKTATRKFVFMIVAYIPPQNLGQLCQ